MVILTAQITVRKVSSDRKVNLILLRVYRAEIGGQQLIYFSRKVGLILRHPARIQPLLESLHSTQKKLDDRNYFSTLI